MFFSSRVLVVARDKHLLQKLNNWLQSNDIIVTVVSGKDKAIKKLKSQSYQVVFADSDDDGLAFLKHCSILQPEALAILMGEDKTLDYLNTDNLDFSPFSIIGKNAHRLVFQSVLNSALDHYGCLKENQLMTQMVSNMQVSFNDFMEFDFDEQYWESEEFIKNLKVEDGCLVVEEDPISHQPHIRLVKS